METYNFWVQENFAETGWLGQSIKGDKCSKIPMKWGFLTTFL